MKKNHDTEYVVQPKKPVWARVVRARAALYQAKVLEAEPIGGASWIEGLLRKRVREELCEVMWGVSLTNGSRPDCIIELARGGLESMRIQARDVMRPMMFAGGGAFVLVHNHPSGDPTPSADDIAMTRRVQVASRLVGLTLLDHVVIAPNGKYVSMLGRNLMLLDQELSDRIKTLEE